jgi:flagellar protein FlbD
MIELTRINRTTFVLNSDLIEHMEVTPDTVISMTTGQKFMVRESAEEVIRRVVEFRRTICEGLTLCPAAVPGKLSQTYGVHCGGSEREDDTEAMED